MSKTKFSILLVVFAVALVSGFAIGYLLAPGKTTISKGDIIINRDTSYVVIKQKPDTIIKKARIKQKKETAAQTVNTIDNTPPIEFVAYDTLLARKDTINVAFHYPAAMFSYEIYPMPDSVKIIESVRERIKYVPERRPLWLDIASHTGVAVIAVALISLIGK